MRLCFVALLTKKKGWSVAAEVAFMCCGHSVIYELFSLPTSFPFNSAQLPLTQSALWIVQQA